MFGRPQLGMAATLLTPRPRVVLSCHLRRAYHLLTCAVTVNVSNLHPLAVPLTQNGSMVRVDGNQEMLFRPVIHLFGNKNRTLDGKVLKVCVCVCHHFVIGLP